jgi:hypothetical protein
MRILKCACHLINMAWTGTTGQTGMITINQKKYMTEKEWENENKGTEGKEKEKLTNWQPEFFLQTQIWNHLPHTFQYQHCTVTVHCPWPTLLLKYNSECTQNIAITKLFWRSLSLCCQSNYSRVKRHASTPTDAVKDTFKGMGKKGVWDQIRGGAPAKDLNGMAQLMPGLRGIM